MLLPDSDLHAPCADDCAELAAAETVLSTVSLRKETILHIDSLHPETELFELRTIRAAPIADLLKGDCHDLEIPNNIFGRGERFATIVS